jgi:hypothetical protein
MTQSPLAVQAMSALAGSEDSGPGIAYQPLIRRADYEAFQHIPCNDLPQSFGTWLHVRRERGMQAVRQGQTVKDVDVSADEFARLCATNGERPTLQSLWCFAQHLSTLAAPDRR